MPRKWWLTELTYLDTLIWSGVAMALAFLKLKTDNILKSDLPQLMEFLLSRMCLDVKNNLL